MSQSPGGWLQQVDEQLVSCFSHQVGGLSPFLGLETISPMWATEKKTLPFHHTGYIHMYNIGVSKNSGTPKSSILIGLSIINHPFWGTPIFGNTHIYTTQQTLPLSHPCCEQKTILKYKQSPKIRWGLRFTKFTRCKNCLKSKKHLKLGQDRKTSRDHTRSTNSLRMFFLKARRLYRYPPRNYHIPPGEKENHRLKFAKHQRICFAIIWPDKMLSRLITKYSSKDSPPANPWLSLSQLPMARHHRSDLHRGQASFVAPSAIATSEGWETYQTDPTSISLKWTWMVKS